MGVIDALKAGGWKPTPNEDGDFRPLKGTYLCNIVTLRPEQDEKNGNAKFYQFELKPQEVLEGDEFGEKMTFRRRVYVDGPKAEKNLGNLLDDLFTAGIELDTASDEAMEASFERAIGQTAYVRAWGWTPDKDVQGNAIPEADRKSFQQWVIQKSNVAEKKRQAGSHAF
jgi:hypothetical protein